MHVMCCYVCKLCTDVVGQHDGEQGLAVGVEGDVEGGGLDHEEDGMEDWEVDTQESN